MKPKDQHAAALVQGTKIKFKKDSVTGSGTIVGIAHPGRPIDGVTYIIRPDVPIKTSIYDYECITASEIQIELI